MLRNFIILILLLIPIQSFGQGKVTRPQKQATHQSVTPKKNNINEPTFGNVNGHDWVDLGLPSGTKWATCNVGASTIYDCGSYFSWGCTETPTDGVYSIETCPTYSKQIADISGRSSYDVAKLLWGNEWCIPTKEDYSELLKYCKFSIVQIEGEELYTLTGRNGNSISFPKNQIAIGKSKQNFSGSSMVKVIKVQLWLSTPFSDRLGYTMTCTDEGFRALYSCGKYNGLPIRPVIKTTK